MDCMGKYFFRMGNPIHVVFLQLFFGSKSVTITKEISDNSHCILVSQIKIENEIYLLDNLYNSNTEAEEFEALHELETIVLKFDANEYNHIIFSGGFNILFNTYFEATGGNAKLKTCTVD